ncbi:hypothetical protein [Chryseobacterium sp. G0201]|uniref:hypothetical protein n=1 Tax=Chryseobacterium sp. G0201 TaxID=2487065 RepID=UPI001E36859C|nr:hypothetical protein [Chryseobacterium sp. G0201]
MKIDPLDKKFELIYPEKAQRISIEGDKKTIYISSKVGYNLTSYYNNSFFMQVKNYYPSRNIENKGIAFNEGAPIGIWYYFDESGKLIKEENTDDGYDFTPKDVVKYCESHKIKLPKGYQDSGYKTSVYKKEIEGKKVWQISYVIAVGKEEFIEEIILDGKTGKLIKKKQVSYINN